MYFWREQVTSRMYTTKMAAQGQCRSPEQGQRQQQRQSREMTKKQKALRVWSADRRERKGVIATDFTAFIEKCKCIFFFFFFFFFLILVNHILS